jgi:hypothetical protein
MSVKTQMDVEMESENVTPEECVENAMDCRRICLETAPYCLHKGSVHAEEKHLSLLFLCAQTCQLAADFVTARSALQAQACALCAEVCEACGRASARFSGDAQMEKCAAACGECARTCALMATEVEI